MAAPEASPATVPTSDSAAAGVLPQLLEQLAQLLQSELDTLLASHDAAFIEQLAARKIELCARIEELQQREATQDPARAQRLRELAQAVAAANQRNGAVLGALIRNTRGALDILRSIPGAETAGMYGPRGETLGTGTAKPLGRA